MTHIPDLPDAVRSLAHSQPGTAGAPGYDEHIAALRVQREASKAWLDSHQCSLLFRDKTPEEIAAMLIRWRERHPEDDYRILCRRLRERGYGISRSFKLTTAAEKIARLQVAMDDGVAALPDLRQWLIDQHEKSHVRGPMGGIGGDQFSRLWDAMHEAFPGNHFPVPRGMGWLACPKDEGIADFDAWAFDHGYDFSEKEPTGAEELLVVNLSDAHPGPPPSQIIAEEIAARVPHFNPDAERLLAEMGRLLAALHAKIPRINHWYTSWSPGRRNAPPSGRAHGEYTDRKVSIYNFHFEPMRPQFQRLLRKLARLHVFPVLATDQPLHQPLTDHAPTPMAHINLTPEVRAALETCTFHGLIVKMPQMERSLYEKVNKVLNNAGGKWSRKEGGHVFASDPGEKLGLTLETGRSIDEKKLYQAFYTPVEVARRILQGVRYTGKRVLEPSAGGGAFADLLRLDAAELVCVELNPEAAAGLRGKGHFVIEGDFLRQSLADLGGEAFDVIVMNPPFSRDQDLEHVLHAFSMLKPGGELVAIVSPGYTFGENKVRSNFREWLSEQDASEEDLAEGTFQESGTPIRTMILAITKPADAPMPIADLPVFANIGGEAFEAEEISDEPATAQGQRLDGVDLQDVLDSAANASRLGKQQYFTPLEAAIAFGTPLPAARKVFVDLMMGGGDLLKASGAKQMIGVDLDSRLGRQPNGACGNWDCLTADVTKLYPLLQELNWQYDLGGFNPPFSLAWETERLVELADSEIAGVRECFKKGRESIDSTLATMLLALDRQTPKGEAYMILNHSTAVRLFGEPTLSPDGEGCGQNDRNQQAIRALPGGAVREHIWLWLTVPAGLFPEVPDLETAVLYFARGHHGTVPLHLTAPTPDADAIAATLATARMHRALMRKGPQVYSDDQSHPTTAPLFRAAAAEYRRLHRKDARPDFNLWLQGGLIHRNLTPFQNFSGKIPKKDVALLHEINGKTPMSLVVQKPTRLALLRAVRSTYWRVQPELLAAVEEACRAYAAERAPFYPLSETQRLGFLDEEDALDCKVALPLSAPAGKVAGIKTGNAGGFTAGRRYPLETQTRKIEHSYTRPNILGKEEAVTLHGQELVIRVKDDAGIWWEFATFTDEELKKPNAPGTLKLKLELLPQHFDIPAVRDVAQIHPEKYQANLTALRDLQALANAEDRAVPHHETRPGTTPVALGGSITFLLPAQPTKKGKTWNYRAYQLDDLARAAIHDGLVFAWDKGLGKTCALFSFGIIKGAKRTLIVAPEALHEQIIKEGREMFGVTVQPLGSQDAFYQNKELRAVTLAHHRGEASEVRGWWITSYTALGYNGGDEWLGKQDDEGDYIVSPKTKLNRRRDPLWKSEADEKGIGEVRTYHPNGPKGAAHKIRCIYQPSLATLVAHCFDYVGVDEAVRLKSDDSYISLGVRALQPAYRLVLTGTPIKNHLDDIFWLAHWACGGHDEPCARWPYANSNSAREEFANTHMFIEENHTREQEAAQVGRRRKFERRIPQICNVHRLWKLLAPAVLCRRKQDIGESLVPKTIVPIRVKPGKAQNTVYKFHCDNPPDFAKNGRPMNPVAQIVAQLQNLRQAALCPSTTNLSSAHIRLEKVAQILREEAAKAKGQTIAVGGGAIEVSPLTQKAVLVARKGESCLTLGSNYAGEAAAALKIVERMMAGSIPIDLDAIYAAAPNLTAKLKPAVVVETNTKSSRSWTDHTPKQAAILKLIEELIGQGEQVVVMSPFKAFSDALYARLNEAGVSVCLLDGGMTPAKRGVQAAAFKRRKYAVLIGGQKSMGEGHSFECAAHLIMPSLDWAYDTNSQCEDRVHRLTSTKPVSIYAMVTENTIDTRLQNLYEEKSDSASLALFAELSAANQGEINLGKLLGEAIANFDPHAETIDELDIEKEWETSLKAKLRLAEVRFREWHPPIVADTDGAKVTSGQVTKAVKMAGANPVVTVVKGLRDATFAVLRPELDAAGVAALRADFEAFCATCGLSDWRAAWRAYDAPQTAKPAQPRKAPAAPASTLPAPASRARTRALNAIDNL